MADNAGRVKSIIKFILAFHEKHGYQPTTREVMWHENIKSTSTVNQRLARMKREGYVDFIEKSPRTLTVTKKGKELVADEANIELSRK